MKNNKGFTVIEGLLILVIVGIIGGTGWYVFNARNKTNNTLDKTSQSSSAVAKIPKKQTTTPAQSTPTADWTNYSSASGQFSVKYPSTWFTGRNQQNCEDFLMLGPTQSTAGTCQSDAIGQMFVMSTEGDKRSVYELDKDSYPDVAKKPVTVNGVVGQRETGTYTAISGAAGIGPNNGTKTIIYILYTKGRTYIAEYQQDPSSSDTSSDFDLMVTKTLKFSS